MRINVDTVDKHVIQDQVLYKPKYQDKPLPFGFEVSNHIFIMDYRGGRWRNAKIVPYEQYYTHVKLDPKAMLQHYGGSIFEGIKCFERGEELYIYRPKLNAKRLRNSAEMTVLESPSIKTQLEGMLTLIDIDRNCYPRDIEDSCFYIRPYIFASEPTLGVHKSTDYVFAILLSPSGPYYAQGFNPIDLMVTKKFNRTGLGLLGQAKTGANYEQSQPPGFLAKQFGCAQVFYSGEFLQEAGTMNGYWVENGTVYFPKLNDCILDGITVRSLEELAKMGKLDITTQRKDMPLHEFLVGIGENTIKEVGGCGTAAVISPVGGIQVLKDSEIDDKMIKNILKGRISGEDLKKLRWRVQVSDGKVQEVTQYMYDYYTKMQRGEIEAPEGWFMKVEKRFDRRIFV